MPRFRFTVRRMMIAVAGIALLLGAEMLRRRSDFYRTRAAYHGHEEEMQQYILNGGSGLSRPPPTQKATFTRMKPTPKATPAERFADEAPERQAASQGFLVESLDRSTLEERRAYHASLKAKYERAARHPWLSVAPDPPEPK